MVTDAQLLEAIRERRAGAFDAFVERYGKRLLAFGLRMCGHREDAEDVFQETLLKAYAAAASLRDPGALRTWLYRVAANQCLMKRRSEKNSARELSLDALKPSGWEDGLAGEIPDWSALPDDEAQRAELRAELERAIGALPPEHRAVVLLRDVEGLSTRETADVLGLGVPAVKMRLHRARMHLRERLAAYREGRTPRGGEAG
ncbi:MAG: sigma-70 family RNA polymerase sigma factor [Acidobacteria bacterium]|nr:MAG: sigma-70 family RNA polymerase sigma factor [Acidobacteriota bacterium]